MQGILSAVVLKAMPDISAGSGIQLKIESFETCHSDKQSAINLPKRCARGQGELSQEDTFYYSFLQLFHCPYPLILFPSPKLPAEHQIGIPKLIGRIGEMGWKQIFLICLEVRGTGNIYFCLHQLTFKKIAFISTQLFSGWLMSFSALT